MNCGCRAPVDVLITPTILFGFALVFTGKHGRAGRETLYTPAARRR